MRMTGQQEEEDKLDKLDKLENESAKAKVVTGPANVFPNGISCKSDTYIPPFREVQINLVFPAGQKYPPDEKSVQCSGVVVKSEKEVNGDRYDVHLYFTDICDEARQRLERYLKVGVSIK